MARSGGDGGGGLKKGPWTVAEDKLLVDHVRRHGDGNWDAVRRETGLHRCGKSCRLRWANHLCLDLRKGPSSVTVDGAPEPGTGSKPVASEPASSESEKKEGAQGQAREKAEPEGACA